QLRFVFIQLGNHGVPRAEFFPALFHFEIRPSSSENVTYLSSTLHFHFKEISSFSIRLKNFGKILSGSRESVIRKRADLKRAFKKEFLREGKGTKSVEYHFF
ncbi:MAG: hypothetical protein J6I74_09120, partial [Schwartzia sp.]|nr:hypothetical protein [Schwartzia sp. (in: firmicutes)]